jgi:hypothetical protein
MTSCAVLYLEDLLRECWLVVIVFDDILIGEKEFWDKVELKYAEEENSGLRISMHVCV